jgi:hypothetical protein
MFSSTSLSREEEVVQKKRKPLPAESRVRAPLPSPKSPSHWPFKLSMSIRAPHAPGQHQVILASWRSASGWQSPRGIGQKNSENQHYKS